MRVELVDLFQWRSQDLVSGGAQPDFSLLSNQLYSSKKLPSSILLFPPILPSPL